VEEAIYSVGIIGTVSDMLEFQNHLGHFLLIYRSLKTDIQTFQTQAMELKSQLQNLRLEYNVLYTEGQMTKETLQ
jgi:hypothetical protein